MDNIITVGQDSCRNLNSHKAYYFKHWYLNKYHDYQHLSWRNEGRRVYHTPKTSRKTTCMSRGGKNSIESTGHMPRERTSGSFLWLKHHSRLCLITKVFILKVLAQDPKGSRKPQQISNPLILRVASETSNMVITWGIRWKCRISRPCPRCTKSEPAFNKICKWSMTH